jgi:hypothetical protein
MLTDVPAAVLIALTVSLLLQWWRQRSLLYVAAAGVGWASATLVRPGTLSYAVALTVWLLLVEQSGRDRLISAGTFLLAFAIILIPWTIRNMYAHGRFVLISTQAGLELYKGNNPNATGILGRDHHYFDANLVQKYPPELYPNEAERSAMFKADAVQFIYDNPHRFIELCFIRLIELWKVYSPRVRLLHSLGIIASFGLILPFFFIQVIRCGWRSPPEILMLLIVASHTAVHMIFTSIVRYRIPIEPLIIVIALQGFSWFVDRLRRGANGISAILCG